MALPATLRFQQPAVWLRVLKVVQQLFMRNEVVTYLRAQLSQAQGLVLVVFNAEQQFRCHWPVQGDWAIPAGLAVEFGHLPVDWMLQFLQRYEQLFPQKQYVQMGLVWQWRIEDLGTASGASWGPNSSAFHLSLVRGDTGEELGVPPVLKSSTATLVPGYVPDARVDDLQSNGWRCAYWKDRVDLQPIQEFWLDGEGEGTTVYRLNVEELRRMVCEWLVMPPMTQLRFEETGVRVLSGADPL
jgi:hypothetical protein